MSIEFECPNCNGCVLEEVLSNVTLASEIHDIHNDGQVFYGKETTEDGTIEHYQCSRCGYIIYDTAGECVSTPEELIKWLNENPAPIKLIVIIRGGVLESMYSSRSDFEIEILDYDLEECAESEEAADAIKNEHDRLEKEAEYLHQIH